MTWEDQQVLNQFAVQNNLKHLLTSELTSIQVRIKKKTQNFILLRTKLQL